MEEAHIHSPKNERVKALVKLLDRKHRDRRGRYRIEGLRELSRAAEAGVALETVYFCPELFPGEAHASWLADFRRAHGPPLVRLAEGAFRRAAYREGPDGLLATAPITRPTPRDLRLPPAPLLLILEGIEKPGNLGAILRTADGAGADAVLLVDCVLDLHNPNTIRASQGAFFNLPVVNTGQTELAAWLRERHIPALATTPDAAREIWTADLAGPAALLLGAEHAGLSDFWLDRADERVRIPMRGRADSLNVAATAAMGLYEAIRQRTVAAPAQS